MNRRDIRILLAVQAVVYGLALAAIGAAAWQESRLASHGDCEDIIDGRCLDLGYADPTGDNP